MKRILIWIFIFLFILMVGCTSPVEEDTGQDQVSQEENIEESTDEVSQEINKDDTSDEMEDTQDEDVVAVAEYRKITAEEAKEMMVEGNLIVDVRTQEEYDSGHIEGAILVPLNILMLEDFNALLDKEQVILVYCRSGNRSRTASQILVDAGYTGVYDFGGVNTWPDDLVRE